MNRLASLALIAGFVVACSGNVVLPSVPAPAVGRATGDICYVLTDAEVAAATKRQPIAGGSGIDQGGLRTCSWTLWFDPVESASLSLTRPAAFEEGRLGGEEDVPSVGQRAYWSDDLDTLTVATPKGTLTVLVWSELVNTRTAAIQLAKLAVPRL
jgi:hypothetical protein